MDLHISIMDLHNSIMDLHNSIMDLHNSINDVQFAVQDWRRAVRKRGGSFWKYSDMVIVCALLPSIYYSIAFPVITLLKAIPHQ